MAKSRKKPKKVPVGSRYAGVKPAKTAEPTHSPDDVPLTHAEEKSFQLGGKWYHWERVDGRKVMVAGLTFADQKVAEDARAAVEAALAGLEDAEPEWMRNPRTLREAVYAAANRESARVAAELDRQDAVAAGLPPVDEDEPVRRSRERFEARQRLIREGGSHIARRAEKEGVIEDSASARLAFQGGHLVCAQDHGRLEPGTLCPDCREAIPAAVPAAVPVYPANGAAMRPDGRLWSNGWTTVEPVDKNRHISIVSFGNDVDQPIAQYVGGEGLIEWTRAVTPLGPASNHVLGGSDYEVRPLTEAELGDPHRVTEVDANPRVATWKCFCGKTGTTTSSHEGEDLYKKALRNHKAHGRREAAKAGA